MKKEFFAIAGLTLFLAFFGCKVNASIDYPQDQPEETTQQQPQPATSSKLCTITGKALYSNSSDNSSIQIYIDKTEGVFSTPALNIFHGRAADLSEAESSRSIVSYKNYCAYNCY